MDKKTFIYKISVIRNQINGSGGYRHSYTVFSSNSTDSDGYRIFSAIGPGMNDLKEHWHCKTPQNEQEDIENRVRAWHPDLDILNIKMK